MATKKQEKQNNKNVITGRNIYKDDLDRTIFYSTMRKQGFVIKAGTENAFRAYSNRFLVAFIAIVFLDIFLLHNLLFSVPLGIAVLAYMEYRWRKLLDTYTMIQNFDISKNKKSFEVIIAMSSQDLILRFVLYLALAVCLVLNIYVTPEIEASIVLTIASYLLSAFALYMAFRYVYALTKKGK